MSSKQEEILDQIQEAGHCLMAAFNKMQAMSFEYKKMKLPSDFDSYAERISVAQKCLRSARKEILDLQKKNKELRKKLKKG